MLKMRYFRKFVVKIAENYKNIIANNLLLFYSRFCAVFFLFYFTTLQFVLEGAQ